jgi:hypothetical protein
LKGKSNCRWTQEQQPYFNEHKKIFESMNEDNKMDTLKRAKELNQEIEGLERQKRKLWEENLKSFGL